MTPQQLMERLKQAIPTGLRSVVLYGSAAAGDFLEGVSDYNVLVVIDRLGLEELKALIAPIATWTRDGNAPPLLITPAELSASADAFPIEVFDMRQSHQVLFGSDPLSDLIIDDEHLRLQLERELKGKLLALRQRFVQTQGRPRAITELMTASLSTFLVLFRAALRLFQVDVPVRKLDAMTALAKHISFDPQAFVAVQELKEKTLARR